MVNIYTSQLDIRSLNISVCDEGWREDKIWTCRRMPADSHLLCCEKFCLSKFGSMSETSVPASQKGFDKHSSVGQWEQQEQTQIQATQQRAFTSVNQAVSNGKTAAEVGLKFNGLNKHYYLNRSPPLQFRRGQRPWSGSDLIYRSNSTIRRCIISILIF